MESSGPAPPDHNYYFHREGLLSLSVNGLFHSRWTRIGALTGLGHSMICPVICLYSRGVAEYLWMWYGRITGQAFGVNCTRWNPPRCTPSAQNTYFSVKYALNGLWRSKRTIIRMDDEGQSFFFQPDLPMSVIYMELIYHIPLALVPHLSDRLGSNDFGWNNAGHHIVHAEPGGSLLEIPWFSALFGLSTWFLAMLQAVSPYSILPRIYTGAVNHRRMFTCTSQRHPFV